MEAGEISPEILQRDSVQRSEEWRTYLLFIVFALFLTALIAPYRSIHLPQTILFLLGVAFLLMCMKFSIEEYERLMLLFCVFAPFQKVLPGDFNEFLQGFNVTNIFAFFLLLGWAIQTLRFEKNFYRRRAIDIPLAVFCLLGVVSLFRRELYSGEQTMIDSLFYLKEWLLPMIIYYIVVNNLRDRKTLVRLIVSVCITTTLVGLLGLKRFYMDKGAWSHPHFSSYDKARIGVICGQPNQLGAFFCYYSFLPLAFLAMRWRKPVYWSLLIPFFVCWRTTWLTFSRGSQIAFGGALMIFILMWSRKVFFFVWVPIVLFFIFCPHLIPGILVGRMANTVQSDGTLDDSSQSRLAVWKYAIVMIKANLLFGVGYGNFQLHISDYGLPPSVRGIDAHNTYLLYAAEMGTPAALLFILVLFMCFWKALYTLIWSKDNFFRATSLGFLAGLMGLIIANMFGSRLNSNEVVFQFWIIVAVIMRMAESTRVEKAERIELADQEHKRKLAQMASVAPLPE